MNSPPHRLARGAIWKLPALVIVLLGGHGVILYYVSSHVALSAAALSGVVILLVLRHLGLLGPLYARFRRRHWGHRP